MLAPRLRHTKLPAGTMSALLILFSLLPRFSFFLSFLSFLSSSFFCGRRDVNTPSTPGEYHGTPGRYAASTPVRFSQFISFNFFFTYDHFFFFSFLFFFFFFFFFRFLFFLWWKLTLTSFWCRVRHQEITLIRAHHTILTLQVVPPLTAVTHIPACPTLLLEVPRLPLRRLQAWNLTVLSKISLFLSYFLLFRGSYLLLVPLPWADDDWVVPNLEVLDTQSKRRGRVLSVNHHLAKVQFDGESSSVDVENLAPVKPAKNDRVCFPFFFLVSSPLITLLPLPFLHFSDLCYSW
jgi:hypothetical protein